MFLSFCAHAIGRSTSYVNLHRSVYGHNSCGSAAQIMCKEWQFVKNTMRCIFKLLLCTTQTTGIIFRNFFACAALLSFAILTLIILLQEFQSNCCFWSIGLGQMFDCKILQVQTNKYL